MVSTTFKILGVILVDFQAQDYKLDQMLKSHSDWLVDQSKDKKISAWLMGSINCLTFCERSSFI